MTKEIINKRLWISIYVDDFGTKIPQPFIILFFWVIQAFIILLWKVNIASRQETWKLEKQLINLGYGLFLTAFCPYFLHLYPSSRWSISLLVKKAKRGSLGFFSFFLGLFLKRFKTSVKFTARYRADIVQSPNWQGRYIYIRVKCRCLFYHFEHIQNLHI